MNKKNKQLWAKMDGTAKKNYINFLAQMLKGNPLFKY